MCVRLSLFTVLPRVRCSRPSPGMSRCASRPQTESPQVHTQGSDRGECTLVYRGMREAVCRQTPLHPTKACVATPHELVRGGVCTREGSSGSSKANQRRGRAPDQRSAAQCLLRRVADGAGGGVAAASDVLREELVERSQIAANVAVVGLLQALRTDLLHRLAVVVPRRLHVVR